MSTSCAATRPAVGGAPVYSPGSVIESEHAPIRPGTALRSCDPPSGRAPAGGGPGGRQGPSEDIAEPWPHVLHCERGRAAGVSAGGRADDTRIIRPATRNVRTRPTAIAASKGLRPGGLPDAGGSTGSTGSTDRRPRTGSGSRGAGHGERVAVHSRTARNSPEQRCAPCPDRTASRLRRARRPNPALTPLDRPNQLCSTRSE